MTGYDLVKFIPPKNEILGMPLATRCHVSSCHD